MNRRLLYIGMVISLLWMLITMMTVGVPQQWCHLIDQLTFQSMTDQVFNMANGFYYDTKNEDMPTVMFLLAFGIIFILYFSIIKKLNSPQKPSKKSLGIIVFFAIIFRLILWPGVSIHENDIYRYLWDGKTLANNINPYKFAPNDLNDYVLLKESQYQSTEMSLSPLPLKNSQQLQKLNFLKNENITFYERISYKEVPTIYPPFAQLIFAVSVLLKQNSILLIKLIFVLFDIGTIFIIIALLKHFNKNPSYCLIYAWSPLILKEIPNAGHYDAIAVFFSILAIYLFVKNSRIRMAISIALAILTKFFSLVLLPFLSIRFKKKEWLLLIGIISLFYVPFVFWDNIGNKKVLEGLSTYNKEWAYNSSIFAAIYYLLKTFFPVWGESYIPAKIIVGIIYLVILFTLYGREKGKDWGSLHHCFLALAFLFILSPVGDPWYLSWAIPLLCFFPYRSWILLSGLLMISYINFQTTFSIIYMKFLNIGYINWIIYLPFFIYLILEMRFKPKYLEI